MSDVMFPKAYKMWTCGFQEAIKEDGFGSEEEFEQDSPIFSFTSPSNQPYLPPHSPPSLLSFPSFTSPFSNPK